jgi:hypothetical protein
LPRDRSVQYAYVIHVVQARAQCPRCLQENHIDVARLLGSPLPDDAEADGATCRVRPPDQVWDGVGGLDDPDDTLGAFAMWDGGDLYLALEVFLDKWRGLPTATPEEIREQFGDAVRFSTDE